jgi:hypothetical protein
VPDDATGSPADGRAALVAELGRRTDVCWVRGGPIEEPVTQAVWHVWLGQDDPDGGALAVVSGGDEQPFPDVADGGRVEVVMRSKDTGGRLVTWVGRASVVRPEDEQWDTVTAALVAARLNLPDPASAATTWARSSVVRRIVPTGEYVD